MAHVCHGYARIWCRLLGIMGWQHGCTVPVPWVSPGTYVASRSPWWMDPNHKSPGAGYLNIVGYTFLNSRDGGMPIPSMNPSGATVNLRMMIKDLDTKGGHQYFWFQTKHAPTGRAVNFALTRYPIGQMLNPDSWGELALPLAPSSQDSTCLGSSNEKQVMYGCAPIEEDLADVNADFGFIVLPVTPDEPATWIVRIGQSRISKGIFTTYLPLVSN